MRGPRRLQPGNPTTLAVTGFAMRRYRFHPRAVTITTSGLLPALRWAVTGFTSGLLPEPPPGITSFTAARALAEGMVASSAGPVNRNPPPLHPRNDIVAVRQPPGVSLPYSRIIAHLHRASTEILDLHHLLSWGQSRSTSVTSTQRRGHGSATSRCLAALCAYYSTSTSGVNGDLAWLANHRILWYAMT